MAPWFIAESRPDRDPAARYACVPVPHYTGRSGPRRDSLGFRPPFLSGPLYIVATRAVFFSGRAMTSSRAEPEIFPGQIASPAPRLLLKRGNAAPFRRRHNLFQLTIDVHFECPIRIERLITRRQLIGGKGIADITLQLPLRFHPVIKIHSFRSPSVDPKGMSQCRDLLWGWS